MNNKKYPIGTKIIFNPSNNACDEAIEDKGKIGIIVGLYGPFDDPIIFLSESLHISCYSTLDCPATWATGWSTIKLLNIQKNEQMLFAFME